MSTLTDSPPQRPRPPLFKRLRPGHLVAIDCVIGAVFTLSIFTTLRSMPVLVSPAGDQIVQEPPGSLVALVLALTAGIAVARRRHRPGLMLGILLAGSFVSVVVTSGSPKALVYFVPVAVVLYRVVAGYENREMAARTLAAVALTLFCVTVVIGPSRGYSRSAPLVPVILILVIAWSIGYIVRQQRRYAIGLQDEAASKAVAEERLRIARELHDVVAHSMSVIAVQAGYGQYVMDSQPEDARAALGAIQATSREALDDMRRMLGALRQADEAAPLTPARQAGRGSGAAAASEPASADAASAAAAAAGVASAAAASAAAAPASAAASGQARDAATPGPRRPASWQPQPAPLSPAPLSPAPGLGDLGRLISRTATVGVKAELVTQGTPRDLPPSIDLSAYRIVQESLTNVVKHANTAACRVRIAYSEDELTVEVTDNGAGAPVLAGALAGAPASARLPGGALHFVSSGHGITGMRERVSLLGGDFVAGPLPGYGFRVTARIPLPAPVAAGARP